MMRHLHSAAIWMAAISAVSGFAYIAAFLCGFGPRSYIFIAVEVLAVTGAFSLLMSVLVAYLLIQWGAGNHLEFRSKLGSQLGNHGTTSLRKRREVLDERLNIDEARLCSQYMIPCTCWSFCRGSERQRSDEGNSSSEPGNPIRIWNLLPEANGLPIEHRHGMDSCAFRFTSPLVCTAPDGSAASDSSDTGMAAQ